MHVSGGFLREEKYRFSDNLNCFIGGRGTGKSTAVRCIAHAMGISAELEDFDNCPDSVVVYCRDGAGVLYRYERMRGSEPVVKAKDDNTISDVPVDAFRVEFYGQALEKLQSAKDTELASQVAQFQAAGLSASVAELTRLVNRQGQLTTEINRIDQGARLLEELREARDELLKQLMQIRSEITERRKTLVRNINKHLSTSIDDYTVAIRLETTASSTTSLSS